MKHEFPKDIFVGENDKRFTLLHITKTKTLGEAHWDILDKGHSGTNARFTAEELCNRYNGYDAILKENTQLKEQLSQLEQRNNALVEALQNFIVFDLSDMVFTDDEDTKELQSIITKAKEALTNNK